MRSGPAGRPPDLGDEQAYGHGGLIAAAKGNPQVAAQLCAASLLAIEVDTAAERTYLQNLASALGLDPQAVGKLEDVMGIR